MKLNDILKILESNNVFLTGGAGVGKSFLTKEVIEHYLKNNKNVVKLGSTGIAAINIFGQTVHSFFKLGIANNIDILKKQDIAKKINKNKLYNLISSVDLIVIDEISMLSTAVFDMIAYRLKETGFKGQVLIVGDFCQLPPVIKDNRRMRIFAFESSLWKKLNLKIIELEVIKRTTNKDFAELLKRIRTNNIIKSDYEYLQSFTQNFLDPSDSTMLVSTNKKAEKINTRELNLINEIEHTFNAESIIHEQSFANYLDTFIKNLPINTNLKLKIGAKILFTKNTPEYYNGEKGEIINIFNPNEDTPYNHLNDLEGCHLTVKKENGIIVKVFPSSWKQIKYDMKFNPLTEEIEVIEVPQLEVRQFPIKLCYALTIHKSQGMSINNLICDMNDLFTEAQFYVSISRSINPENLQLMLPTSMNIETYINNSIELHPLVIKFYKNNQNELPNMLLDLKRNLNLSLDREVFEKLNKISSMTNRKPEDIVQTLINEYIKDDEEKDFY